MLARNDSILTLAVLALGLAACGDARPALGGGGGGGGACTTCHGTAGRAGTLPGTDANLAAAPPVAPAGEPSQVVGAHQAHLNPAAPGSLTGPLACGNCHDVPTSSAHATNPPALIVQFALLATTGGAAPTWNSTDKTTNTTCSNVYCHGNFTFGTVTGNAANAPDWTQGSSQATCGSCHGLPPTGHISLPGTPTAATCNGCHPGTVDPTGQIIVNAGTGLSLHINGRSDVSIGSCTACHGTAGRTGAMGGTDPNLAAAPPLAPAGEPSQVVGAHLAHLNPAATGSLAGPIACNECHVVPTDSTHATNPPPLIVQFGTLATTGGASAAWNSTDKINNTTCSNVYCHGTFTYGTVTGTAANTPDWTGTDQATCGSCHGLPPTGHISISVGCNGCHPGTVAADGTIIVNTATGASLHVNGQANEGAHTDSNWYVNPVTNPTFTPVGGDHTVAALDYTPPSTGVQGCLQCHVNFESPTGDAGSSCNACHTSALTTAGAATTNWQQNCVFCHGDKTKLLTYVAADQTSDPWIIAPPVGTQGETLTTDLAVGAHQKHVNPGAGYNVLSNAIACTECHPTPLPGDVAHVDGVADVPLAGTLATTGGVQGTWTAPSCSATYCHGNYPAGGNAATPVWTTVDGTFAACTSCHGAPPNTGEHYFHMFNQDLNCSYCHNGIATGSGTGAPVTNAAIVGTTLHVNGVRDVVFPSSFTGATWIPGATPGTGTCNNILCHGTGSNSRNW